jgi:hypothetical protein
MNTSTLAFTDTKSRGGFNGHEVLPPYFTSPNKLQVSAAQLWGSYFKTGFVVLLRDLRWLQLRSARNLQVNRR